MRGVEVAELADFEQPRWRRPEVVPRTTLAVNVLPPPATKELGRSAVSDVRGGREPARVDLNRCLGCGHCIAACPQGAIALEKKTLALRPPETREALFRILKANRKGGLGKAKLAGKLVLDMIRTGNLDLLK